MLGGHTHGPDMSRLSGLFTSHPIRPWPVRLSLLAHMLNTTMARSQADPAAHSLRDPLARSHPTPHDPLISRPLGPFTPRLPDPFASQPLFISQPICPFISRHHGPFTSRGWGCCAAERPRGPPGPVSPSAALSPSGTARWPAGQYRQGSTGCGDVSSTGWQYMAVHDAVHQVVQGLEQPCT